MFQGVSYKDSLELVEKLEGVLDVSESCKVRVDEVLKIIIEESDLNVELDKFSVELVVLVVEQIESLVLKFSDQSVKPVSDITDTFKVVLLESIELHDGGEYLDELANSSAEQIKLSKDCCSVEVKLSFFE